MTDERVVEEKRTKMKSLFIHCSKCGCRNSALTLRCWYCKTKLKN